MTCWPEDHVYIINYRPNSENVISKLQRESLRHWSTSYNLNLQIKYQWYEMNSVAEMHIELVHTWLQGRRLANRVCLIDSVACKLLATDNVVVTANNKVSLVWVLLCWSICIQYVIQTPWCRPPWLQITPPLTWPQTKPPLAWYIIPKVAIEPLGSWFFGKLLKFMPPDVRF